MARESVLGGDFQAILFNRIILPEHTAETEERQVIYK